MLPLTALLLAGALDAGAALEHASRLAALGPHAFGSPRNELAAEYVAAELRDAGVAELQRQPFSAGGRRGVNVIGVLRGSGPGFVVLGAHHDSPEGSPGAWEGGGVALLIEAARALQEVSRTRTLVIASWDGGAAEGWPGARAWLDGTGADARHAVAVLVVEGGGRPGGVPLLRTPARPSPLQPGRSTAAPAWLVERALAGAASRGVPLRVSDGRLGWLFQVADRVGVALRPVGDRPFVAAGLPALVLSDDGPSLGPRPAGEADTVESLDAAALGRLGDALVAAAASVASGPRGADDDARWFAAGGVVLGEPTLLLIGAASLVPVAAAALSGGAASLLLRALQAAGFGLLLWRAPVAGLWCLLLPQLALLRARSRWLARLALLPALALVAAVALGASRTGADGPLYAGSWLAPWELAALGLTLLAAHLRPPEPRRRGSAGGRRAR